MAYPGKLANATSSTGVTHELEELRVGVSELAECVACLLHTILFTRAPGPVRPAEAHCRFRPITYAYCPVAEVTRKVDAAIVQFQRHMTRHHSGGGHRITVMFFETRVNKALFGLVQNEEKVVWEKWTLPIRVLVHPSANPDEYHMQLESQLRHGMLQIVSTVQTDTQHIPIGIYDYELLVNDDVL
ncbi:hypothetical protein H257_11788 [Aphanomyces astaci]|uniref:Autophagy-related protein 101 n=1 Tax=Aphanomyces astaci TaxID=112090 RepID=W4G1U1_APHAT|nr:hypothetical protein H257_11788 [Aphanomyces astaci]ETV73241.1 hypothetical protein H257_11788 [Aphanomyces astaci]KAF0718929.1 hypothetical protein AaE_010541 [Aphanomyces astaci]RHY02557.1 hypothetical protein DYB25_005171 [Aphanomyces astaci]RHY19533.1 hypothetical protein DYB36_004679 [Aphanomyces astaci]RHY55331.1 hypothetical protein DYB30_008249 [Aphanomyces astaci]|eukprot:XP_009837116.1 hypothetical protein H257_11788 [Aphanomyces astaci]